MSCNLAIVRGIGALDQFLDQAGASTSLELRREGRTVLRKLLGKVRVNWRAILAEMLVEQFSFQFLVANLRRQVVS